MCEKCHDLNKKIEEYRQMAARDPTLTERTAQLISELIDKKIELHTVRNK